MQLFKRILRQWKLIVVFTISLLSGIVLAITIFMSADKHNVIYCFFATMQAIIGGGTTVLVVAWVLAIITVFIEEVVQWIFERIKR